MDTTPKLALPYPEPTDPITDYPALGQDLAELLESLLAPICDVTLAAPAAGFDTNTILGGNIPAIYKSLVIVAQLRSVIASTTDRIRLRFNADASAIYDEQGHRFSNNFSTDDKGAAQTGFIQMFAAGATAPAGSATPLRIEIPNYANAVLRKQMIAEYGYSTADAANSQFIAKVFGQWRNTAAITRLQLDGNTANFATGSRFTLYGRI
jgi:hypothetical protein